MTLQNSSVLTIVKNFLNPTAELLNLSYPQKAPAVVIADLDGDGNDEIAAAYRLNQKLYILVLKHKDNKWIVMSNIDGKGYNITYFNAANISSEDRKDLIVGWQMGAIWSELDILQWTPEGFKDITKSDIFFSKIDIEDMPGAKGTDGMLEIALWTHDTGEAYKVEVYRWDGEKLSPATDVYPYYFRKVARYYEAKVKEMPGAAFYWYYLAYAQFKAGLYDKALKSIDKAVSFNLDYPTKKDLLLLREDILSKVKPRVINLHPANIKTLTGVYWGYIDNSGSFVLKPVFGDAMEFQSNGLAVVQSNNLYGIIDSSGNYVVKPTYDFITQYTEDRAVVIDKGNYKVIDHQGKILTQKDYNYISSYKDGRAMFSISTENGSSLYGYLDKEGKEIIPAKYISANDFNLGKATVQIDDNTFSLIDNFGKILSTFNFPFVGAIGDGLLPFKEKPDGNFGYIDEKGKAILPPKYTMALPFTANRAVVNLSEDYIHNKYGLIDKSGKFIIPPQYNDIQILDENRAAVGKALIEDQPYRGSMYALADLEGNILTDFTFTNIGNFKDGIASASDNKNTFFIDLSGKVVRNLPILEGSGSLSVVGQLIKAFIDNKLSYYDKTGKLVWTQNTIIPLNRQYSVVEKKYKPNRDYLVYYPQVEGMKDIAAQNTVNLELKKLSEVKPIDSKELLDYSYSGDFNVEFFKNKLLVLELYGYNFPFGAAHGMPTEVYPHIDLVTGKFYQLKDLFKPNSDYVTVLSNIIGEQIKSNPEYSYVFPDAYKGIAPDQPFYVNENDLYIYFNPYDIAPYAAGFPTFKIPFAEIMNIINTEGDFWKSFKE